MVNIYSVAVYISENVKKTYRQYIVWIPNSLSAERTKSMIAKNIKVYIYISISLCMGVFWYTVAGAHLVSLRLCVDIYVLGSNILSVSYPSWKRLEYNKLLLLYIYIYDYRELNDIASQSAATVALRPAVFW